MRTYMHGNIDACIDSLYASICQVYDRGHLNADGFGLGWYTAKALDSEYDEDDLRPCVFTEVYFRVRIFVLFFVSVSVSRDMTVSVCL